MMGAILSAGERQRLAEPLVKQTEGIQRQLEPGSVLPSDSNGD